MNPDEIEQLESRLRQLPLRGPSASLDARIALLGRPVAARRPRRLAGITLAVTVVAASLLLMVTWQTGPRVGPAGISRPGSIARGEPSDELVRIDQVWCATSLDGIVADGGGVPMQRVSRQVVRHVRVIDDARHVRIDWNIPHQETALEPLEFN